MPRVLTLPSTHCCSSGSAPCADNLWMLQSYLTRTVGADPSQVDSMVCTALSLPALSLPALSLSTLSLPALSLPALSLSTLSLPTSCPT